MEDMRFDQLEARVLELEKELNELKGHRSSNAVKAPPPRPKPAAKPVSKPREQRPTQSSGESRPHHLAPAPGWLSESAPPPQRVPLPEHKPLTLEDVLNPRNLAIAGVLAVLAGLVFLVSYGISNGWITEEARVIGAAIFSCLLAGTGLYLREARQMAAPAELLVVLGLAGLFISLVATTRLYELVGPVPGLLLSGAIAALGFLIGWRWKSEMLTTGVLTFALLSPLLVGAAYSTGLLAFLLPAFTVAVAAAVARPWALLFPVTGAIFLGSLLASVADASGSSTVAAFALSLVTMALVVAGATGRAFRTGEPLPDSVPAVFGIFFGATTAIGVLLVTGAERPLIECGYEGVSCQTNLTVAAGSWLVVSAVIAAAIWWLARRNNHRALGVTAFALGSASLAAALGFFFQGGPLLSAAWSVEAACLIGLGVTRWQRRVGLTVLAAAAICAFVEVPPSVLWQGTDSIWRDLAAIVPPLLPLGLLIRPRDEALQGLGAGLTTCLLAYVALIVCGHLTEPDNVLVLLPLCLATVIPVCLSNRIWAWSMFCLFGLAAFGFTIGNTIPLDGLIEGVPAVGPALASSLLLIASALALRFFGPADSRQPALWTAAGFSLYFVSVMIVDAFQGGTNNAGELPVEAQGQVIVSSLWALTGLVLVLAGLLKSRLNWRKGGLIVMILALAKISVYDLASLNAAGRTISFIAVGLILLATAFAYQWMNRRVSPEEAA